MGSFVCEGANKHVKAGRLGDVQPATTFPSQFAANSAITKGEKACLFFSASPPYNRTESECDPLSVHPSHPWAGKRN